MHNIENRFRHHVGNDVYESSLIRARETVKANFVKTVEVALGLPIPNLIAGVALINFGFPVGFAAAMGAIASAPALLFSASLVLSDILIMKGKITPQTAHTITSLTLLVATVASVAVLLLLVPEVAATIMSLALLGVTLLGLYYSYTKYSTLQDRSAIDVLTGRNGPVNYI